MEPRTSPDEDLTECIRELSQYQARLSTDKDAFRHVKLIAQRLADSLRKENGPS